MAIWFGKRIFSELLVRDTERFRADLRRDHDLAIERMRADLSRVATEHSIRFQKLHEQTASVMATLFQQLEAVYAALQDYASIQWGPAQREERFPELQQAFKSLVKFYFPNRLFLPKPTAERVHVFIKLASKTLDEYHIHLRAEAAGSVDASGRSAWDRVQEALKGELNPLLEEVHDLFQQALGFEQT